MVATGTRGRAEVVGGDINVGETYDVLMHPLPGSYKDELVGELEARNAKVRTSEGTFPILTAVRNGGVPDVIHLHFLGMLVGRGEYRTPAVPLALACKLVLELCIAKVLGARVVWTVHNLVGHGASFPRLEVAARHVVARLCDAIIVHCDTAREIVADTYRLPDRVRTRVQTVPHGNYRPRYPDDVTEAEARERLGIDDDTRVFLFFGLIRPYKNVDDLIRAFQRVDAPDAELLVVGRPHSESIEADISSLAHSDERIRTVFEFVPDEEVQLHMRAADVVVLPFESVLTSGSVILGMTFERPVIAPKVGCPAELLSERGGFPYDPDDSDGLKDALARAYTADLEGMGEYNYRQVEPLEWSWIAERTLKLYRD